EKHSINSRLSESLAPKDTPLPFLSQATRERRKDARHLQNVPQPRISAKSIGKKQPRMAANYNSSASGKLTVAEAKVLLLKNKDNVTNEMKDSILDAFTREAQSNLLEARKLWAKKKPLNKDQSVLLMDWMWSQIDHTKVDSEELFLVKKPTPAASVGLFGAPLPSKPTPTASTPSFSFGTQATSSSFGGAPAPKRETFGGGLFG
ncbi:hypothetical protein QBC39DRAFT_118113, partial [Podospora conica]